MPRKTTKPRRAGSSPLPATKNRRSGRPDLNGKPPSRPTNDPAHDKRFARRPPKFPGRFGGR